MRITWHLAWALCLFPTLALSVSVQQPLKDRLVGKWESVKRMDSAKTFYTFRADGTFATGAGETTVSRGTWSVSGDALDLHRVRSGRRYTTRYAIKLTDDDLVLTSGRAELRFKREGATKDPEKPKEPEKPREPEKPLPLLEWSAETERKAIDTLTKEFGTSVSVGFKKPDEPVTRFFMTGEKVNDEVLGRLKSFVNLQSLTIQNCRVTDEGMKELKGLKRLQEVRFTIVRKVTGKVLQELSEVPAMRKISIEGVTVTNDDLKALQKLTDLRHLLLIRAGITDEGLPNFTRMSKLESLYLEGNPLTNAGMKEIRRMTNLRELGVNATQLTDAGVKELTALRSLEHLRMDNDSVTDACIKDLKQLPNLQRLNLGSTSGFTNEGVKQLSQIRTLREITLNTSRTTSKITDEGIRHLMKLPNLEYLGLSFSNISRSTIDELKANFPKLQVSGQFVD